ncbi:MAG TPA: hypothetical protein VGP93_06275, partial [Polyangiaceae bacterium]|nr:hypothetical protein [Polyangiaceae bacterium]
TPTLNDESSGLGDTRLRARWEISHERPPSGGGLRWPAFALLATISVPGSESEADHAASLGVGAWEVALGADIVSSLTQAWQLEAIVEVAERSPDTTLGFERQLGPRALFQLGSSYALVPELRLGALTTLSTEGDASYENQVAIGSGQRLWTVSAFISRELASVHAQASLSIEHAPGVEGIAMNAVRETSLRAALSWAH